MNSSSTTNCVSAVPWWVSFVLPLGCFTIGLIIIGFDHFNVKINRVLTKKKLKKSAMIRRKTRLMIPMNSDGYLTEAYYLEEEKKLTKSAMLNCKFYFEVIVSKASVLGRLLSFCQLLSHILSWMIYVYFTYFQFNKNYVYGDCYMPQSEWLRWADFGLNVFCCAHFIMRSFIANDILKFWFLQSTLVDICVIPNILLTTFLNVRRQGLSFLRIFYLHEVWETILISFGLLNLNNKNIERMRVILNLFSLWLIGGGFFHMAEGIGNFWTTSMLTNQLNITSSAFCILITMSTVGFGDTVAITVLGQIVVFFYMFYGITLYVTTFPDVVRATESKSYSNKYVGRKTEKYVIVSGSFDNSSLIAFLKTFKINKYRKSVRNLRMVVMKKELCDETLSLYLKKFICPIKYLSGSLLTQRDIKRVSIRQAKVVIILSLPFTHEANDDDLKNIIIAMYTKAQHEKIRTIVQLHLFSNKILLKMFSRWNANKRDIILCLDELKLSLMGYNCLVPGISTLITNMMTRTKLKKVNDLWRRDYETGLQIRLFNVQFSDDFHGMPCLDVSLIMYKLWDVCLLAIKYVNLSESDFVAINPVAENLVIDTTTMIAIVMARDDNSVQRVSFYCSNCSQKTPWKICQCSINSSKNDSSGLLKGSHKFKNKSFSESTGSSNEFSMIESSTRSFDNNPYSDADETGSFYWVPEPKFDDICLNVEEAETRNISDHILVCLCGSGKGKIDMCNFMMPLRSRSLISHHLKTIVILGKREYFENHKWINIKNFPMFLIVNGSPTIVRDLKAAGVLNCHSCAIINIDDSLHKNSDKYPIICTNLIRSMRASSNLKLPIITEIRKDEVAFLFSSSDIRDIDSNMSVQHTEPFASGIIFTNSILYSCIYSIYHNPDTFSFVKTLLSGLNSDRIEQMFGSGVGLLPRKKSFFNRHQSGRIIQLLPVCEPPISLLFSLYKGTYNYETLFQWALSEKQILCLGLYRTRFEESRYVYTHPEKDTEIFITDNVYCFITTNNSYL